MILEKLKEYPKQKYLILIIIITSIPFFLLTIIFVLNEIRLISSTGYGILHLELAGKPERIQQIFNAWDQAEIQIQIIMHYIDYLYIPIYGLFGMELVLLISRKLEGKFQNFGLKIAFLSIIAGVFDTLENINLILMLNNSHYLNPTIPFLATFFANFKIALIIMSLEFFYIAFLFIIFKRYDIKEGKKAFIILWTFMPIAWLIGLWYSYLGLFTIAIFLFLLYIIINFNSKNNN